MSQRLLKVRKTLRHHAELAGRAALGLAWDVARPLLQRPIFVVGCSRAGTTVVYKTLSASREIGSLQRETHDFWAALHPLSQKNWNSHALNASDATPTDRTVASRYFISRTGHRRIVDKNNQNGLCVAYLHALFQDAHFVYVRRSPGDNIHSLIEGWGKANEFATWSQDLPAPVAIEGGRYNRWCFFLASGWRDYAHATIEEVCAFQYHAMNRAIIDAAKAIPASQWSELVYEQLLQDPVREFKRVFEACELAFTPHIEQRCETVLDTPYNAFSEIRADKWRGMHNRARIERVLPRLAGLAAEMGYPL